MEATLKVKNVSKHIDKDDIILEIFRNRQDMEAQIIFKDTGEIIDRIPVKWKSRENKLDYLSVSKISAYEQCPANFYRTYISEETKAIDNSNYFTKFGSILHEVVENELKIYRDNGIIVDPVQLLQESWSKADLQGFGDYNQAKELIIKYFKNNPVDSRPDKPKLLETEWRGELGGTTFGLVIDYAGIMKNNEEIGLLRDYKSNRMPFTSADLQNSLQLRIYELVLRRHLLPDIKEWITGYDLFFYGWQACPKRSMDDLLSAEEYVANTWQQIQNDNIWEERLNQYCRYRSCRFTCEKYKKFLDNPTEFLHPVIATENTSMEDIEKERELMAIVKKNADGREKECANILKYEIEESMKRGEKFVVDGKELSLFAQSKTSYRYNDVKNVLLVNNKLELLEDCLNISKTKFDAKISGDPTLKLQLAGCMNTNYTSPYIISKKVKSKK